MKRDPNAKVYKPAPLPPPTLPTPSKELEVESMSEPPAGPAGADVVFVNDEGDESNA